MPKQLLNDSVRRDQFVHPDDRSAYDEFMAKVLADGTGRCKYRILDANQSIHWVAESATMSDQDGKPQIYGLTRIIDDLQQRGVSCHLLQGSIDRRIQSVRETLVSFSKF